MALVPLQTTASLSNEIKLSTRGLEKLQQEKLHWRWKNFIVVGKTSSGFWPRNFRGKNFIEIFCLDNGIKVLILPYQRQYLDLFLSKIELKDEQN